LLSAGAASAAASAGINLFVSVRSEHRKWAREALIEAFIAYKSTSLQSDRACRMATEMRNKGATDERLDDLRQRTQTACDAQDQVLTRLRLLSTASVAQAAVDVHDLDHELVNLSFTAIDPPADLALDEVRQRLRVARDRLIAAGRSSLYLRGRVQPELPVRFQRFEP
jgi:hypothetical protein